MIKIEQSRVNNDGLWWVVAKLPSGLAHDPFTTEQAARDFVRDFYGVSI